MTDDEYIQIQKDFCLIGKDLEEFCNNLVSVQDRNISEAVKAKLIFDDAEKLVNETKPKIEALLNKGTPYPLSTILSATYARLCDIEIMHAMIKKELQ